MKAIRWIVFMITLLIMDALLFVISICLMAVTKLSIWGIVITTPLITVASYFVIKFLVIKLKLV